MRSGVCGDAKNYDANKIVRIFRSLAVYQEKGVLSIAQWLRFRVAAKPATLIKHLRSQMEEILLEIIINPGADAMDR